ncbi:MAG UNVERIFIED_CONTAM: tRNA glutamyl-Q(34) synthetase GluQRS [Planctomycetaceae bacterium]|jgi:glutamyl-Q tRNA(Asp) synthetase
MSSTPITRFAPSPTGLLHRGHAFSALAAWELARALHGICLLRIEDIDATRCRPEFELQLKEDLLWLGLNWPEPVRRQSEHLPEYQQAAEHLLERGLLYPCFCTRRDIQREITAAGGAPHGAEGPLYPGTCRLLSHTEVSQRMNRGDQYALRLNLERARQAVSAELTWTDLQRGRQIANPECLGDVVLVRKDIGCSYHLCVVFDDALQGVTHISRGEDLFEATHLHRLLQALLDLPVPIYSHHPLLHDATGKRLAKRAGAESLLALRQQGLQPDELRRQLLPGT